MSDAILLGGKRGAGKSLGALHMMQRYISEGRTVATNLDIYLENLVRSQSRTVAYRLPDHPSSADLEALPLGNPALYWEDGEIKARDDFDEEKNGLLALDELATFLNSRNWQGKDRQDVISWLVQSRKYGWDLLLLAQHPRLIDAQIREALIEVQGQARRLDKIKVPFLGNVWKWLTGKPLRFPKIHVVGLFYGFEKNAPLWDRWVFRGKALYAAYNTRQKISAITGNQHLYTMLSAWHLRGRYMSQWEMYKSMIVGVALIGALLGFFGGFGLAKWQPKEGPQVVKEIVSDTVTVSGVMREGGLSRLILSDGRLAMSSSSKADMSGERFLVDGTWYRMPK